MCIKSRTARRSTSDNATKPGPLSDQLDRYNWPSPEPPLTASSLQALPVYEICSFCGSLFFSLLSLYSQNEILKIKSAKIIFFLRFSIAIISKNKEKSLYFYT
jgi:hypothetical protein